MRRRVLCRYESDARSALQYLLRAGLLSVLSSVQLLRRRVLLRRVAGPIIYPGFRLMVSRGPGGAQRTTDTLAIWQGASLRAPFFHRMGPSFCRSVTRLQPAAVQSDRNVTFAMKREDSKRCLLST